jgi:hypothetical protein
MIAVLCYSQCFRKRDAKARIWMSPREDSR